MTIGTDGDPALDPGNFVSVVVCLACADGDHHVCYGGPFCECRHREAVVTGGNGEPQ